jgi:glycosyltransferase involved in cell wall biosynthesis
MSEVSRPIGSDLRGPKLAMISHLPIQRSGGGVYAVSWQIVRQLQRHFELKMVAPISTPIDHFAKLSSRIRRNVLRVPGSFFTFSKSVLRRMAASVDAGLAPSVDAVFFRTSTRWIGWNPDRPYFVHTDVCFHTFFHNTFRLSEFLIGDLERIWHMEAQFLDRATAVFFESWWGLAKAKEAYRLSGKNFFVMPNAGAIEAPVDDRRSSDGRFRIITIAKHFQQKGGDLVADAFGKLKPFFPELTWHILGGSPPNPVLEMPDVHYEGFLRPDVPIDLQRMTDLLAVADVLVHPTREDTNPLVLIEAASFGCPCISVRSFAIPELVVDGQTGVLIEPPATVSQIAESLQLLLTNPQRCLEMRRAARIRALQNFSWDISGNSMASVIFDRMT